MTTAFIISILKNKWTWIIIGSLILIFIIRKNWNYINAKLLQRDFGDYTGEKQTSQRKEDLESLAEEFYDTIYGIGGASEKVLAKGLSLTDDDLKYLAKYYDKALTRGNTLYQDIDDEKMPFSNIDEQLLRRLSKLGLK